MLAAAAIGLCMVVVNAGNSPVTLHGCVPSVSDDGLVVGDCLDKTDPDYRPPVIITVPGAWHDVIYDADRLSWRLWDAPKSVAIHWRNPCPTNFSEGIR